ncbi:MAG: DUF1573 domain-containing protein [Armatimonadetes bacterium]|nr:DUF1573 domain-containing protein [Akkermansiaceae bacterium]
MKICLTIWLALANLLLGAGLKFDETHLEVHAALDAKEVVSEFKFTNSGTVPVKIKDADAGCSCLSVKVVGDKLSYAPGESGTLRATFEIGSFQGAVDKPIHIWLDGDAEDKPSHTLVLRVHIPVIIKLEPKTLKWEIGDEATSKVIDVMMEYGKPIHITSLTTGSGPFTSKLITLKEGKHYQIEVTPENTNTPGLVIVRIETDVDVAKQRVQQGFAVVKAKLQKP